MVEFLSSAAIALIVWQGGQAVLRNEHFLSLFPGVARMAPGIFGGVTVGVLIAFIQYAQRFFRPIQDLSDKYNILQAAMAASERIFKLLDTAPEIVSPAKPVNGDGSGRVEFRNVWFTYQRLDEAQKARIAAAKDEELAAFADIEWILCGVSFVVEPDETAAIVGHTGAGKTTIIGLMMRFYDIQRGSDPGGWRGCTRAGSAGAAAAVWRGAAGSFSVYRDGRGQHPAGVKVDYGPATGRGRGRRECGRVYTVAAGAVQ